MGKKSAPDIPEPVDVLEMIETQAAFNRTGQNNLFGSTSWTGDKENGFIQEQTLHPAIEQAFNRIVGQSQDDSPSYQSDSRFGDMMSALLEKRTGQSGAQPSQEGPPQGPPPQMPPQEAMMPMAGDQGPVQGPPIPGGMPPQGPPPQGPSMGGGFTPATGGHADALAAALAGPMAGMAAATEAANGRPAIESYSRNGNSISPGLGFDHQQGAPGPIRGGSAPGGVGANAQQGMNRALQGLQGNAMGMQGLQNTIQNGRGMQR